MGTHGQRGDRKRRSGANDAVLQREQGNAASGGPCELRTLARVAQPQGQVDTGTEPSSTSTQHTHQRRRPRVHVRRHARRPNGSSEHHRRTAAPSVQHKRPPKGKHSARRAACSVRHTSTTNPARAHCKGGRGGGEVARTVATGGRAAGRSGGARWAGKSPRERARAKTHTAHRPGHPGAARRCGNGHHKVHGPRDG
jgi:hypothetical protein